ncbi:iron ABC transporter permease [Micromonospora sp. NBC_01699]|uniref:ABC transporter permease n=1 Tax=Micromonospora sp. NBC_01699 TaxID=2975984 RepID=UPI002E30AB5D|nr:iron ABC transporter permease [Micromonospora sp. NBC_01699]
MNGRGKHGPATGGSVGLLTPRGQTPAGGPTPSGPARSTSSGVRRRARVQGSLVFAFVAAVTLVPVGMLLFNSLNVARPGQPARYGFANWEQAFSDPTLRDAAWNTFRLGVPRVLIGLVIATVLSWLIARTDMPGGKVAEVLFWFAFFIPSLSMTLGWILLADPTSGAVNQLLRHLPGLSGHTEGPLNIYSYWGIIWSHLTATTVPIMTILLIPSFRRMNASLEEAAQVSGASRWRTAIRITVPVMLPTLLGAALLSFIYSLKAFEIELLLGSPIGLNVYSTQIYDWIRDNPPSYGIATALGAVFIPVLILLAVAQRYGVRRRNYVTLGGHTYSDEPVRLGRVGRWVAAVLVGLYLLVTAVLPIAAIVVGSFMRRFGFFELDNPFTTRQWTALFDDNLFLSSIGNSLLIGLAATLIGIVFYFAVAYVIVRSKLPTRGGVDVMAWLPAAIPGILLGLGLLWLYLDTPLRTVLYGNLLGLTIAVVISHMSTGTQQIKVALMQVSPDLEAAARISGAGALRANWRILLPLAGPAVAAAGVLTFHSAVSDISTVVLLSSNNSRPLSVLLLEYSTSGALEQAAAVGVVISALTVTVALIARALTGGRLRRGLGPR